MPNDWGRPSVRAHLHGNKCAEPEGLVVPLKRYVSPVGVMVVNGRRPQCMVRSARISKGAMWCSGSLVLVGRRCTSRFEGSRSWSTGLSAFGLFLVYESYFVLNHSRPLRLFCSCKVRSSCLQLLSLRTRQTSQTSNRATTLHLHSMQCL